MPTTKARCTSHVGDIDTSSSAMDATATQIFSSLGPLHRMSDADGDLLRRAAAGLRFIRSTGTYSDVEHELFSIALADLGAIETTVVEMAACYAAGLVSTNESDRGPIGCDGLRRAMWLAAILRLADGFCTLGSRAPESVYAVWTAEFIFMEFDGQDVTGPRIAHSRARVAALEALTERRVLITGSTARRGAA